MFPCVYFFFPETRLRSLEEMDDIFKKSSNVFDVVPISVKEPYRYDKHGQLKQEYIEEVLHNEVPAIARDLSANEKEGNSDTNGSGEEKA